MASQGGKIVLENTLDARLNVAFRQNLPEVCIMYSAKRIGLIFFPDLNFYLSKCSLLWSWIPQAVKIELMLVLLYPCRLESGFLEKLEYD